MAEKNDIDEGSPETVHHPRYFRDQPLLHADVDDEYLIVWHFEDWLKKYFFSILQILEVRPFSATHFLPLLITFEDTITRSVALY